MTDKATQIRTAAERLFAARRYHEVTLDDVCKEAGVGKGTVYRYFENKEDLFRQVILGGFDELVCRVRQLGDEELTPSEGLRRAANCMACFFRRRGGLYRLMQGVRRRRSRRKGHFWREWRERGDAIVDVFARFIQAGMDDEIYSTEFPASGTARLLMAMLMTGFWHGDSISGTEQWQTAIVDLFEKGLMTRDGKGAG